MEELELKSGGKEIILTTSFLTFDNQPVDLKFTHNDEIFNVQLVFEDDGSKKTDVETIVGDEKLILKLKNLINPLGSGSLKPFVIASISQSQKIFCNFWINKPSKESNYRLIHITFYKVGA